jgi:hypothetical protein
MTALAGRLARVHALWTAPSMRFVRELSAWAFGVIAPIVCFGLAVGMGLFARWGVLVFGYAACSIAAFIASQFLRSSRRPVLDSLVAGSLCGAFLFSLPFAIYFGFLGSVLVTFPLLFGGGLGELALGALGLAALPGSLAYGLAARRTVLSSHRIGPWIAGFFAPPLLLFAGQCAVWREVDERTPQLLAAIDAGVPVEQIDIGGLRILGPFSDWPGLKAEIEGDSGPETQRDLRIAELHWRLTGRSLGPFSD